MTSAYTHGELCLMLTCTAYFGLSIGFSLQLWNALSRPHRSDLRSVCLDQCRDCVVALLVFLAVMLVELPRSSTACAIALGILMVVLIVRLVRRVRTCASFGQ